VGGCLLQAERPPGGRVFGVIASTTAPFCRDCDRARITADGVFFTCLYATHGLALRPALRRGDPAGAMAEAITEQWRVRRDRGAEERAEVGNRTAYVPLAALRADPHLEMHKRGG
jgi:cyclic pyranopterin phosphate synthase